MISERKQHASRSKFDLDLEKDPLEGYYEDGDYVHYYEVWGGN